MIGEGLISSQLKMKKTNKPGWKLLKFAAEKRKVRYTVFTLISTTAFIKFFHSSNVTLVLFWGVV